MALVGACRPPAIGDTVNLASRREGANKVFGTSVLISEATSTMAVEGFLTREIGDVSVTRPGGQRQQAERIMESKLSVEFWGVRGSAPVCGLEHLAFGGSTMCIEVTGGGRRIILDAGTGIQRLGAVLRREDVQSTDILLSHYHMDHIMGLMTFAPLFVGGANVTVHAPVLEQSDPVEILNRLCNEPFFPMDIANAGANFAVKSFQVGEPVSLPGFDISTIGLAHPGGSCGYRIASGDRSLAVIVDHEHGLAKVDEKLAVFCRDADLLIYDAHWDARSDYEPHLGWGHSTWQAGLDLMRRSGAARLGCVHHAPNATDATLEEREADLQREHPLGFFAREGQSIGL